MGLGGVGLLELHLDFGQNESPLSEINPGLLLIQLKQWWYIHHIIIIILY